MKDFTDLVHANGIIWNKYCKLYVDTKILAIIMSHHYLYFHVKCYAFIKYKLIVAMYTNLKMKICKIVYWLFLLKKLHFFILFLEIIILAILLIFFWLDLLLGAVYWSPVWWCYSRWSYIARAGPGYSTHCWANITSTKTLFQELVSFEILLDSYNLWFLLYPPYEVRTGDTMV